MEDKKLKKLAISNWKKEIKAKHPELAAQGLSANQIWKKTLQVNSKSW